MTPVRRNVPTSLKRAPVERMRFRREFRFLAGQS